MKQQWKDKQKSKKSRKKINHEFDVVVLPKNPREINFVQLAKRAKYSVPIDLYKKWWDHNRAKAHKKPITQ